MACLVVVQAVTSLGFMGLGLAAVVVAQGLVWLVEANLRSLALISF